MPFARSRRALPCRAAALAATVAAAALVSACASSEPPQVASGSMSCLDDSPHCISQRQTALRHLVTRSDRHWVRDRASVDSYASGVRLFAFKTKKKDLTCDELQMARREADSADVVLRGPEGRRLTPAQLSRGSMFAAEVSRELSREQARRCRRG